MTSESNPTPDFLSPLTDREMLTTCLSAFEAIPTADTARKFLKNIDGPGAPYAGTGQHILAKHMRDLLRQHLQPDTASGEAQQRRNG